MYKRFPTAAQALQNWIAAKNFSPGTRLPTNEVMAKKFGFTLSTMLRATQALVSGGELYRQGYKLTVAHKSKAPSPLGTIVVVSCPPEDCFTRAIKLILTQRGINFNVVEIPKAKLTAVPGALAKLSPEKTAGIILRMTGPHNKVQDWLRSTRIPTVVYAPPLQDIPQSSVQMDMFRTIDKAIDHLYKLGHRRIARFSIESPYHAAWFDYYHAACSKRGLKESVRNTWYAGAFRPDVIRNDLLKARKLHPEVTAVVTRDELAVMITQFLSVPRDLSVVGFGEVERARDSRPALTLVALRNPDVMASWACNELIAQIQATKSETPLPASEVLFVPELILGKSTRSITTKNIPKLTTDNSSPSPQHPAQTWRNIYPFLKKTGSDNFRTMDLSKLANHSLSRHHGWLGAEPLEHFPPGLRSIHGVPFQVLDEERNGGRAVVTFRSPHSHSSKGNQLPTRARIPVNSKLIALYFLHGCGYAKPIPFAKYIMHFTNGRTIPVPLIPMGPSHGITKELPKNLRPNLQDWWWGDYDQKDFPHAHHARIYDVSDPIAYERTIYSLEWINPHPREEIRSIEVRVDSKAGPILALISVTALLDKK